MNKILKKFKQVLNIPSIIEDSHNYHKDSNKKIELSLNILNEIKSLRFQFNRFTISSEFIKGKGLEIGALHNPLKIPDGAIVRYVDRKTNEDLRREYPELDDLKLVNVDIIDDGESFSTIPNDSQDFIIANHMLEHCKNPIQTISNFLSKLKAGGILYLAIPDKRFSFDRDRPLTEFSHLVDDYFDPNNERDYHHYLEWTRLVDKIESHDEIIKKTQKIMEKKL